MIKINLVPAEILAKAHQKQRMVQFGLAGAAVAFLVFLVSWGLVARLHRMQNKLAADKIELQRLSAIVAKVKESEAIASQLQARLRVIDDLDHGRRAYPYFMNDFVASVPAGVRVRNMTSAGGGGSAFKLTIAAEARSNEDIALWVRQLEQGGRFSSIELGPVNIREIAGGPLRNFSLTAGYTPKL